MAAHHATITHCPQGHLYDVQNTWLYGGHRYCRACRKERRRVYDQQRGPRDPQGVRAAWLRKQYNLTPKAYAELLHRQEGTCAICRGPEPADRRMAVDHDHETGRVRGLLCTPCNVRLFALENTAWRLAAEAYLTEPIT